MNNKLFGSVIIAGLLVSVPALAREDQWPKASGAIVNTEVSTTFSLNAAGESNIEISRSKKSVVFDFNGNHPHPGDRTRHGITVTMDDRRIDNIRSIEGAAAQEDAVEYKDSDDRAMHLRPGRPKPIRITLEREWSNSSKEFRTWRNAVLDGKVDRRSITISFHNDAGEESMRASFQECSPVRWSAPESLGGKEVGTEALVVDCESGKTSVRASSDATETVVFRPHRGEVK